MDPDKGTDFPLNAVLCQFQASNYYRRRHHIMACWQPGKSRRFSPAPIRVRNLRPPVPERTVRRKLGAASTVHVQCWENVENVGATRLFNVCRNTSRGQSNRVTWCVD